MSLAMVTKPLLSATHSMCLVLIEGLYSGMCAVPENNNKGGRGRGVSVLHEGPIDGVTPLGLPFPSCHSAHHLPLYF